MYNTECKPETNTSSRQFKEVSATEMKTIRKTVSVIFKAVTLAMGVAVVVLSCLGSLEVQTVVTLLGIGLACAGAAMLAKQ